MASTTFELHLRTDQDNHVSSKINKSVDRCLDALSEELLEEPVS